MNFQFTRRTAIHLQWISELLDFMPLVISGGTALQRCDKYALRCGSSRRETSTLQSFAKTPTTPPATHSSAKPTPRSGDAGTPIPRNAENSALIQSPHFSHA